MGLHAKKPRQKCRLPGKRGRGVLVCLEDGPPSGTFITLVVCWLARVRSKMCHARVLAILGQSECRGPRAFA